MSSRIGQLAQILLLFSVTMVWRASNGQCVSFVPLTLVESSLVRCTSFSLSFFLSGFVFWSSMSSGSIWRAAPSNTQRHKTIVNDDNNNLHICQTYKAVVLPSGSTSQRNFHHLRENTWTELSGKQHKVSLWPSSFFFSFCSLKTFFFCPLMALFKTSLSAKYSTSHN